MFRETASFYYFLDQSEYDNEDEYDNAPMLTGASPQESRVSPMLTLVLSKSRLREEGGGRGQVRLD